MSLFPDEDVLTKEIQSWRGFADQLPVKDRQIFMKMLNDCYKYSTAINAKGQPFPSEPVIMALLLSQHKLIEWLENQWKKVRGLALSNIFYKWSWRQAQRCCPTMLTAALDISNCNIFDKASKILKRVCIMMDIW